LSGLTCNSRISVRVSFISRFKGCAGRVGQIDRRDNATAYQLRPQFYSIPPFGLSLVVDFVF
jgi:hypothetical protein